MFEQHVERTRQKKVVILAGQDDHATSRAI
jgi:hypothetical protein